MAYGNAGTAQGCHASHTPSAPWIQIPSLHCQDHHPHPVLPFLYIRKTFGAKKPDYRPKSKSRVAKARNKRHFDAALGKQNLQLNDRAAQLEKDLIKAAKTIVKNKKTSQ